MVALKNAEVWVWGFASPPAELGGGGADAEWSGVLCWRRACAADEPPAWPVTGHARRVAAGTTGWGAAVEEGRALLKATSLSRLVVVGHVDADWRCPTGHAHGPCSSAIAAVSPRVSAWCGGVCLAAGGTGRRRRRGRCHAEQSGVLGWRRACAADADANELPWPRTACGGWRNTRAQQGGAPYWRGRALLKATSLSTLRLVCRGCGCACRNEPFDAALRPLRCPAEHARGPCSWATAAVGLVWGFASSPAELGGGAEQSGVLC